MADFDWSVKDDVIMPSVQAVAVYPNRSGGITIRQQADWDEDKDHIIHFPRAYAEVIANAILHAANEVEE